MLTQLFILYSRCQRRKLFCQQIDRLRMQPVDQKIRQKTEVLFAQRFSCFLIAVKVNEVLDRVNFFRFLLGFRFFLGFRLFLRLGLLLRLLFRLFLLFMLRLRLFGLLLP